MRLAISVLLVAWTWGCAGTDTGGGGGDESAGTAELGSERPDEPDSTRASREAASSMAAAEPMLEPVAGPGVTAPPSTPVARPPTATEERRLLTVTRIEVADAEDGRGRLVPATNAIAFDLDARRFPPGGRDPVLHVGELVFSRYEHPRLGVLRFTCADRSLVPEGAQAYVQYGDDASTRVVVSSGLVLP